MRIIVPVLIAVLGLTAVVQSVTNEYLNDTLPELRQERSSRKPHNHKGIRNHKLQEDFNNKTVDCCPTLLEMVEPTGGKNQDGIYVELYRDHNYRQRFYELSCRPDVLNEPCKFINKKLHSKCVQKYSFTYALVKDTPIHRNKNFPQFPAHTGGATYTLDYISVRSGCSCVVTNNKKKRNKHVNKSNKHHS